MLVAVTAAEETGEWHKICQKAADKIIIKEDYEQWYTNQLDDLDDIYKFPKWHKMPKLIQEKQTIWLAL